MVRTRSALVIALIAAPAIALSAPMAASSDGVELYTWAIDNSTVVGGFTGVSPEDASLTLLEDSLPTSAGTTAVEVCGDVGFAVRRAPLQSIEPSVLTWNPATGAVVSGPVDLTTEVDNIMDIDTLAGCTLLALVYIEQEPYIAQIDPVTGDVDVIVELPILADPYVFGHRSLATDAAGTTFVGYRTADGPFFRSVDLLTNALGTPIPLTATADEFGIGSPAGADFDAAGGLWLRYGPDESNPRLVSYSAGADLAAETPRSAGFIGTTPGSVPTQFALAATGAPVGPAPAPAPGPQLAATGAETPVGIVLAAGILLLFAGVAAIGRRRPQH